MLILISVEREIRLIEIPNKNVAEDLQFLKDHIKTVEDNLIAEITEYKLFNFITPSFYHDYITQEGLIDYNNFFIEDRYTWKANTNCQPLMDYCVKNNLSMILTQSLSDIFKNASEEYKQKYLNIVFSQMKDDPNIENYKRLQQNNNLIIWDALGTTEDNNTERYLQKGYFNLETQEIFSEPY